MKHAFKRLTALIMIMVFTCISLIGCTKHTHKNDIRKITLNEVAHSIFYAPQYVAIEKGYFKDEGIDLTLVTGFGADKVMTALFPPQNIPQVQAASLKEGIHLLPLYQELSGLFPIVCF